MRVHYEGLLVTTKYANKLTPSTHSNPPFTDDMDFESFEMMGRSQWATPLVTYEEKYGLLSDILRVIRGHCGSACDEMILNSRMPSTIRMPQEMFGSDLFLVLDVAAETRRLWAEGRRFISIQEGFVRNLMEEGENELVLDWYRPPADAGDRLHQMIRGFEAIGLKTCCADEREVEAA
ncbi:MAG: hypothetical protein JO309_01595 [Pseudonocardiales bacterium]|nr:hypothetical protein [Hyphomicrobiales bacterium]MBV8825515.1 hypothetical protein [Hyphomicrobiales bacterium]MBV9429441.1 hypothetical protein [Bradyrhizobiaceae bacterium]MBV9728109.1 hypothetical protein [Pseudonocardiales bacterium]